MSGKILVYIDQFNGLRCPHPGSIERGLHAGGENWKQRCSAGVRNNAKRWQSKPSSMGRKSVFT
jgi:hypothetical protein